MKFITKVFYLLQQVILEKTQSPQVYQLNKRIDKIEKQLKDMEQVILETVDLTGGTGWTNTVQNAIMQLDKRLDILREVLVQHEENFKSMTEEEIEEDSRNLN